MEKDFFHLKTDQKKISLLILSVGFLITIFGAVNAYRSSKLQNGYELVKSDVGEGEYEQEIVAHIEEMGKVPLTITVEEKELTEEEAEEVFERAILILENNLLNGNESFEKITGEMKFIDVIPKTPVEVTWTSEVFDYFYSDGKLREDVELSEPTEIKIAAVLRCQGFTKDYEKVVTIFPKAPTIKSILLEVIYEETQSDKQREVLRLPSEYEGKKIVWKKPLDTTFIYFGILSVGAVVVLQLGSKRDMQQIKKKRLEELEKDYAQMVSKFSMLLMAGLSIRNAWERIVLMERRKNMQEKAIFQEMNWALHEMKKGVSEIEIYETFGCRVGLVHYKKLMSMFVSHKRRGGTNLLEAMNQEMLQAWEEKKRRTRQQGEKIGTKLLIPMMGMLTIVFLMILVPAFLSF